MMCQFCGKNHATNKFLVSFMGGESEVFICNECLEKNMQGGIKAWPLGIAGNMEEKRIDSEPLNVNGMSEIRMKRKLNQLHMKLSNAVKAEKYEEAAILRDEINDLKEVFVHGK